MALEAIPQVLRSSRHGVGRARFGTTVAHQATISGASGGRDKVSVLALSQAYDLALEILQWMDEWDNLEMYHILLIDERH